MAAGDLTDLAHVGAWLQMQSAQYNVDAILPDLISDCSAAFVNACSGSSKTAARNLFTPTAVTETRDGNGKSVLLLRSLPVNSVSSVVINGLHQSASPDGVQAGYVFDDVSVKLIGWPYSFARANNALNVGSFCKGYQNVVVTYNAGFAALPGDARRAVTMWVAHLYRGLTHTGERSKVFEQHQATVYDVREMPDFVSAVVERYRIRMPIY